MYAFERESGVRIIPIVINLSPSYLTNHLQILIQNLLHDKYKIVLDSERFKLEFEDDCDEFEDFHEKYYYEPDEQSKEVQERSIVDIPEISINDWIINIFGEKELFRLDDKNKYTY